MLARDSLQFTNRPFISVIGGSQPTDAHVELAFQVGRELAIRGAVVVCGGLGGVMEAVCRGAKEAGGLTVGILPGIRREDANPFVDIPIVTSIGFARNASVVLSGQAVIAIDGSWGTLSEIAYARTFGVPVIGLDTWNITKPELQEPVYSAAGTAVEAVELALEAVAKAANTPERRPE